GRGHAFGARGEQGGVPVLEPAASRPEHVQEQVALEGKEAPERAYLANEALQVPRGARGVPGTTLAGVDQEVTAAVHFELVDVEVAGHDRRIDEGVEVGRPV